MKSKVRRAIIVSAAVFLTASGFSGAFAEQAASATGAGTQQGAVQKKGHEEGPLKGVFEAYAAKMKTFWEQKRKEGADFRASLKDKAPAEQKTMIDQFRAKQSGEIKAFVTKQRADLTSQIQSSGIPDDKKGEILRNMKERWAKVDAHVEKQIKENKQTLDQIYSDDAVTQEEKELWKEQQKAQLKENREFRDSMKPDAKKQN